MKTCELDGCDGVVKKHNLHFCSVECANTAKTINSYIMVENCKKCDAKMQESDYHKELSGTSCSKYCKACRNDQREDRVAEKKLVRKFFSVMFNSMASCGYIKF